MSDENWVSDSEGRWIYDDSPVVYWFNPEKSCPCKTPIVGDFDHRTKQGRCMYGGKISEADLCFRRRIKR